MYVSGLQPVVNYPALLMENKKFLIVADLHIGIQSELAEHGVNTESRTKKMTEILTDLVYKNKVEQIILLGDVKHNIPSSTFVERKDVKYFLQKLAEIARVHIIPGNHDGNIKKIISENVIVHSSNGYIIDDIGFIHGHRWPKKEIMQCAKVVIAHTHPTVMFVDRRGFKTYYSCWVKTGFIDKKLKSRYPDSNKPELIIMPAFNPLCGGISVNSEGVVGPMGKIIDIPNARVFLLDGSSLGKVKNIK